MGNKQLTIDNETKAINQMNIYQKKIQEREVKENKRIEHRRLRTKEEIKKTRFFIDKQINNIFSKLNKMVDNRKLEKKLWKNVNNGNNSIVYNTRIYSTIYEDKMNECLTKLNKKINNPYIVVFFKFQKYYYVSREGSYNQYDFTVMFIQPKIDVILKRKLTYDLHPIIPIISKYYN
jgi:hypothetical protein